jgi:hypothetical protein
LFGRIAIKKPALNEIQKRKCKNFFVNHREWNATDWSKVIFSDESKLEINPRCREYVRRPKGTRNIPKYISGTTKFSPSLMVWGAIGIGGDGKRILIRCEGNVDSNEYQRVMETALPLIYNSRYILQQDGASCHSSRSTRQYFERKSVRLLQQWPPQSPDLNIIEGLWDFLKVQVRERKPKTLNELWEIAQDEWTKIPIKNIKLLYQTMPRLINAIIASKGGNSKY